MKYQWMFLAVLVTLLTGISCRGATKIVVPRSRRNDKGLALAIEDLRATLNGSQVVYSANGDLPSSGDVIVLGGAAADAAVPDWESGKPESYRIKNTETEGRPIVTVQGVDSRGLMYGTFKLAEKIRMGRNPYKITLNCSPAFSMRMYSEEGQLLDLPDLNYYSDEPPYVNKARLKREVKEAKELIDRVAGLGYDTITFLHVNCEDYIDYRYLDKQIYPEDGKHRQRSPIFCRYLAELCEYAHKRHMDLFLQLYEFQYPPRLEKLYNIDLKDPDIEKIISAKCRELFERVPLDGLVITPTESHPRCGYKSTHLWKGCGRSGAGRMLTLYHDACRASGGRAVFRLWRVATDAKGAREAAKYIPTDAMFSVKNTGSDFWLNFPLTDMVTEDIGEEYPLMVVFDPFRQYDGWSQAFCYMKRYGRRIRLCNKHNVQAVNAWGAWSPACIWPTYQPGYMNGPRTRVPWAGYWNRYRIFTRGFSAGQANVYLLSRLLWDPHADPGQVARDFCHLHLGSANAEAAAQALMASQPAWRELYPGTRTSIAHPVHLKWTMVFGPRSRYMEQAYKNYPLPKLLDSNQRALEKIRRMEESFADTDRSAAPDKTVYDRFERAIDLTALTIRTLCLYREWWWRGRAARDLQGDARKKNAEARTNVHSRLKKMLRDGWAEYPEEAAHWKISYRHAGEPTVYARGVFPSWWPFDVTLERSVTDED